MALTTTPNMPSQVEQVYIERMLSTPTPNLIHTLPADKVMMPANSGNKAIFSRYDRPAPALVPLGNSGATPPSTNLNRVDIQVEMQFYGAWYEINDQVVLQNQDRVLTNYSVRAAFQMRETEDALVREMMAGTAAVIYATNGGNGDNPTNMIYADIGLIGQLLRSADAMTLAENIEGSNQIGTGPVRNAYMALCHTDLQTDLGSVASFRHSAEYPSQTDLLPSEYGSSQNIRFFTSSVGSKTLNASLKGADVYNVFCCGVEALMMVEQDRYSTQMLYIPAIYRDPLAQNASLSWKMAFASRISNDEWLLNMKCTRNV